LSGWVAPGTVHPTPTNALNLTNAATSNNDKSDNSERDWNEPLLNSEIAWGVDGGEAGMSLFGAKASLKRNLVPKNRNELSGVGIYAVYLRAR